MLKILSLALWFLIFLSGCNSVPQVPNFAEVKAEPNTAVVYIYRLRTPPYARKPDIKVNDIVVAELPTNSYTALKLKSGTYTIKTDWGFLDNLILSRSASLSVVENKSYYVHFAGNAGLIGTTVSYGARVLVGDATTIPSDLASCSYVAPLVASPDPQ